MMENSRDRLRPSESFRLVRGSGPQFRNYTPELPLAAGNGGFCGTLQRTFAQTQRTGFAGDQDDGGGDDFHQLSALPGIFSSQGLKVQELIQVGVSRLNAKGSFDREPAPWLISGQR